MIRVGFTGARRPLSVRSTVRYAREIGREVMILWPNGITTVEPAFSRQGL